MVVIGVDIGGTSVKIGIFDVDGNLICKDAILTRTQDGGSGILPDLAEKIKQMTEEASILADEVIGLGVTVPGAVDHARYANGCINLGWGYTDVAGMLTSLTGYDKITVVNDANAAAAGELWQGAGKGVQDLVMVTLGTGVGGGVVLSGRILAGAFGAAGEIGHIKVSDDPEAACNCGKKGCLEQFASATGIVRIATEMLQKNSTDSVLRGEGVLSAKSVFDAAKEGDALALQVAQIVYEKLGGALATVSCVVDPQLFVIGGGVAGAGSILLDGIKCEYRKAAFHASTETAFALAQLGGDAGIYGAAYAMLNAQ